MRQSSSFVVGKNFLCATNGVGDFYGVMSLSEYLANTEIDENSIQDEVSYINPSTVSPTVVEKSFLDFLKCAE
jgi:hypothetical protein